MPTASEKSTGVSAARLNVAPGSGLSSVLSSVPGLAALRAETLQQFAVRQAGVGELAQELGQRTGLAVAHPRDSLHPL